MNGNWYWIDKKGLSDHSPIEWWDNVEANSINNNGQIVYEIKDSTFSTNIHSAANYWNQQLGKTVFVEASKNTASSNINLYIYNISQISGLLGQWKSDGNLELNTYMLGKGTYTGSVITNVMIHEFGHSLGLNHTGDYLTTTTNGKAYIVGKDAKQPWSWSNRTDTMWATNSSSWTGDQTILTANDVNAVKLIFSKGIKSNTQPFVSKDYSSPVVAFPDYISGDSNVRSSVLLSVSIPAYYAITTSKNSTNKGRNNPEEQSNILYPAFNLGE